MPTNSSAFWKNALCLTSWWRGLPVTSRAGSISSLSGKPSRFSPAAQSLAEADIIWSCTCPKTGVVTPVENPCSITSYIGLDQLLRSSICQKKMPHEILYYRSSTSEFRLNTIPFLAQLSLGEFICERRPDTRNPNARPKG